MSEGIEVVVFPPNRGAQWSDTVGSTLWEGGARRNHLDIVLGPVEIAAVVLPASAGGVVISGAWYLARWHSVGPTD